MTDNPFSPPLAAVADREPLPPGSPVKAVLLGLLVDIGGTLVAGVALGIAWSVFLFHSGLAPAAAQARMAADVLLGGVLFNVSVAIGCGFSLLGGYVCGRIVRRQEFRFGAILAALSECAGLLLGGGRYDWWLAIVMAFVTVACVLAGAHLAARANRRG